MRRSAFILACILSTLLISSFSASAQRTGINLAGYSVNLEPFSKNEKKYYQLEIIHPYAFSQDIIKQSLQTLIYKKDSFLGSKEDTIFKKRVVDIIAPIIADKFRKADRNQKIAFEIYSRSGEKYIQGDTFLTSQGLNWRFSIIRWEKRAIDSLEISGEPWVLFPQKNQTYKKWRWEKSKRVSRDITNWLISENILPDASNILPESRALPPLPQKSNQHPSETRSLKDRLMELKQLRKENLISEEEYQAKRKELLSDL